MQAKLSMKPMPVSVCTALPNMVSLGDSLGKIRANSAGLWQYCMINNGQVWEISMNLSSIKQTYMQITKEIEK